MGDLLFVMIHIHIIFSRQLNDGETFPPLYELFLALWQIIPQISGLRQQAFIIS